MRIPSAVSPWSLAGSVAWGWLVPALALATFVQVPQAGAARKPSVDASIVTPVGGATTGPLQASSPGCNVGVAGPHAFLVDYIQPPDDTYYVRVSPSCAACPGAPGVWISSLGIALENRVPCHHFVEVAVVDTLADTSCARPDPSRVLLGPHFALLTSVSPGTWDWTIPFDGRLALTRPAYLRVTFVYSDPDCAADSTRPRLVTNSSCRLCQAWNYYPADTTDLCAMLLPGTPVIYAVVDSCVSPSFAGVEGPAVSAAFLRVSPNPTRAASDIHFTLATASRVTVEIHDVAGRRLREVLDAPLASGEHSLRWDGRDENGRPVPAGSYFAVVRAGDRLATRRIVFVR